MRFHDANRAPRRVLAFGALAIVLLAGCGGEPRHDDRLIVFARAPATNVFSDLYLLQTDGSLRRLTHGGIDSMPTWSPDGRQIAFQRAHKGQPTTLYVANADGSGDRSLPDSVSGPIEFSPDGTRLLYVDDGRVFLAFEGFDDRLQLAGGGSQHAADARWSPDGTRIVFALGGDQGGDVYVMTADGGDRKRLTHLPAGSGFPDTPLWSPDGKRIAFLLPGSLHVMNADGSDHRVLARFPPAIFPSTPAWSPDSRSVAYARLKVGRDRTASGIYVADVESGEIHRLTREIDSNPSWSPDGRQVVFQRLTGFHVSEITLMDSDGSNQTSLTQGGWSDTAPAWRPDAPS